MTASADFDRLLGEWLDEGPRRAPDRPLDRALAHARSHPRRPDPLRFLRADVMAPRRSAFGLRPVLVLAALVLLVVAALAIGGGAFRTSAPPAPPLPSPSASVAPSAAASVAPSASPDGGIVVELNVPEGQPQTVEVLDESGLLATATSGNPTGENGQSFPFESVEVSQLDPTTLQLGWAGFPCATDHTLVIDETATTMTLTRPDCEGETDSSGVDRIVVLEFIEPVDATDVAVTIQP
jgi:hypothetical protein